jgi:cytochrome P450
VPALRLEDVPEISFQQDAGADPYAYIKALRDRTPIARGMFGMVVALRHRHLDLVTSDLTRQIETETKLMQGITSGPIFDLADAAMLFANGAAHRRRRNPVSKTFAFKLMDAMRPRARAIAHELVSARLGAGEIDFVSEIAAQIPARIIADILGIPESDLPIFLNWIADTAAALGFVDPARRQAIEASLEGFNAYVAALLEERRSRPRDDFITGYLATTAADETLSELEIRTQILGLILAGSDTTRGSLCMTLAHMLKNEAQWSAFVADPDGLKKAVVDEGLRFEPVVGGIPRVAVVDLEIDGYLVPAGTPVAVSLVSALRDPDVYKDPDVFDIGRADHPRWHPVFGAGAHRCVGEALARAEMEETLAVIARIAPRTRLIGAFPRLAPGAIRQVGPMQVAFAA